MVTEGNSLKRLSRKLVVFGLIGIASSSAFASDPIQIKQMPEMSECATVLLSPEIARDIIREQFKKANEGELRVVRVLNQSVLAVMGRGIESKIIKRCVTERACTPEEIQAATMEIADQIFGRNQKIVTNSVLVGLNLIAAGGVAVVTSLLPKESTAVTFITVYLSTYISNMAWEFIAPVIEPKFGKIRQKMFSFAKKRKDADRQDSGAKNKGYGVVWQESNAHFSPQEQLGRDSVSKYSANMTVRLMEAHKAIIERGDFAYAADQVADIAIFLRSVYSEVPPEFPVLVRAAKTSLVNHTPDSEKLEVMARRQIQLYDPYRPGTETANYYERLLTAWFH